MKKFVLFCVGSSLNRERMWPNGIRADPAAERDAEIRHVTQVLCKAKLLGIVSGKEINSLKKKFSFLFIQMTFVEFLAVTQLVVVFYVYSNCYKIQR